MTDFDKEARQVFHRHRAIWRRKPALQRIYREEFFALLMENCVSGGKTLEIGSGAGFFKEFAPEVISSDVVRGDSIDVQFDCQHLPFANATLRNIVGLDVLHHIERPLLFIDEVSRTLCNRGRLVLIEPWITPLSFLIYRYLHQDDCDWSRGRASLEVLPTIDDAPDTGGDNNNGIPVLAKDPLKGNVTIPFLLFAKNASPVTPQMQKLKLLRVEPFSFLAYALSFGFKPFNLMPSWALNTTLNLERRTRPTWQRLTALRALIVLEKP